jgi:hypothetical protein
VAGRSVSLPRPFWRPRTTTFGVERNDGLGVGLRGCLQGLDAVNELLEGGLEIL